MKGDVVKKTPLYDEHIKLGAKMVEFAGFNMPVQYKGVIEEHMTVRTKVGMFDVSHMGEFRVKGNQAFDFVQYLTTNDVAKLSIKQVQYSAFPTEKGTVVDDLLVYKVNDNEYLLVVNAANIEKDFAHLSKFVDKFDVSLTNESDDTAQMAIQGPKAEDTMFKIFGDVVREMKYYWFDYVEFEGETCLLSRTGYTGEDGFEIYCKPELASKIWNKILDAGEEFGIEPCGLGARDTLRLEARMNLYGNDMDETTTVLEAGLGWICKLDKGDFLGRDVLLKQKEEGLKRKLYGFEMIDKGIPRHGYPVFHNGEEVGVVTSGSYAPYLKKNIGLAYLPIELAKAGNEIEIGIRKKRAKAITVKTPFYKRPKK
uniref:glycine cleavage system aminomethyltransferase GcvT n=1 Tax=Thermotomaculum hydrothermale TaxID=981385 RepID=UPI0038B63CD5